MLTRNPQISIGKRVGGALYIHQSAIGLLSDEARSFVESIAKNYGNKFDWNVAKIATDAVSLLKYEDFDDEPFPRLLTSIKIDPSCKAGRIIDWSKRKSPPILHRKELLLPPDDRRIPRFTELTNKAEALGLFKAAHTIGTVDSWQKALDAIGAEVDRDRHDISLTKQNSGKVLRHRTAIVRSSMSVPLQLLVRHRILKRDESLLDYGCGQGDDVAALHHAGYRATGWDPHFAPDTKRKAADIVNLGFVLNVIEEQSERISTLKSAWSYATGALTIATMLVGRGDVSGSNPYKDGFLTSRGTFQKYFDQHELKTFIQDCLDETAIALGPGIFVVFRNKEKEQEFLLAGRSHRSTPAILPRPPLRRPQSRKSLAEKISIELDELAALTLKLGRLPDRDETPEPLLTRLADRNISLQRALTLSVAERLDSNLIEIAANSRREDLLLNFALAAFSGIKPYSRLPNSLKKDIRAFFSTHAKAIEEAKLFLFSLGNSTKIESDCRAAANNRLGTYRMTDNRFRCLSTNLELLPIALRGYVACAEVLHGNLDGVDVIDIRPLKSTIALSSYDDISRSLPELKERVIISLARQRVDIRKPTDRNRRYLFWKSKLMSADSDGFEQQMLYDQMLCEHGALCDYGPELTAEEFDMEFADLRA